MKKMKKGKFQTEEERQKHEEFCKIGIFSNSGLLSNQIK